MNCSTKSKQCGKACVTKKYNCRVNNKIGLEQGGLDNLNRPVNKIEYSSKLNKLLKEEEDRIRNEPIEHMVVLDPYTDEVVMKLTGDKTSVGPKTVQEALNLYGGKVITHNHPSLWDKYDPRSRGVSFSPADVNCGCRAGAAEVRAITRDYNHSIKPPKDVMWDTNFYNRKVTPEFNRQYRILYNDLMPKILNGQISQEDAEADFFHIIWTRVSEKTGMRYSRTKINSSKRKDSMVRNKKLKCNPGNKPCGKTCIPQKQKCKVNNPRVNGKGLSAGALAEAGLVVGGGIVAPIASMGLLAKKAIDREKSWREEKKKYEETIENLNNTSENLKEKGSSNAEINRENMSNFTQQVGQAIDNKRKAKDEETDRENSKKLEELRAKRVQEAKEAKAKKQKDREKEIQRKSDEIYSHKYKKARQKQLKDEYIAIETGRDRHEEYNKKKSSKKLDSVLSRIKYTKLDSRLQCNSGNKKCGKICIPQKLKCNPNKSKLKSAPLVGGLVLPTTIGLNQIGGGIAGVGILGGTALLINKKPKELKNINESEIATVKKEQEDIDNPIKISSNNKSNSRSNKNQSKKKMDLYTQSLINVYKYSREKNKIKRDSKLNCNRGNKQCGKACIPNKSTCNINNPKIKSSPNLASRSKKLLLPASIGIAGVGLIGGGVALAKKVEAKSKDSKYNRNKEYSEEIQAKMAKWGEEPVPPMKTNYEKGEELNNTEYSTKTIETLSKAYEGMDDLSPQDYAKNLAEQLKQATSSSKVKDEPVDDEETEWHIHFEHKENKPKIKDTPDEQTSTVDTIIASKEKNIEKNRAEYDKLNVELTELRDLRDKTDNPKEYGELQTRINALRAKRIDIESGRYQSTTKKEENKQSPTKPEWGDDEPVKKLNKEDLVELDKIKETDINSDYWAEDKKSTNESTSTDLPDTSFTDLPDTSSFNTPPDPNNPKPRGTVDLDLLSRQINNINDIRELRSIKGSLFENDGVDPADYQLATNLITARIEKIEANQEKENKPVDVNNAIKEVNNITDINELKDLRASYFSNSTIKQGQYRLINNAIKNRMNELNNPDSTKPDNRGEGFGSNSNRQNKSKRGKRKPK